MKYLLDTNICIYFLNGNPTVVGKMKQISSEHMTISLITLAELQFGAYNSKQVQNNLKRIDYLEKTLKIVPITSEITSEYARIKAKLRRDGNPVDDFDILIGATAIAHGLTLITNNTRHFSNMESLSIENWSVN